MRGVGVEQLWNALQERALGRDMQAVVSIDCTFFADKETKVSRLHWVVFACGMLSIGVYS